MDFITDLPLSRGFNSIFTCVDKLTKYLICIPCTMGEGLLSAEAVAQLLFEHVVKYFGLPMAVLHDRDPRFTSTFWGTLW